MHCGAWHANTFFFLFSQLVDFITAGGLRRIEIQSL